MNRFQLAIINVVGLIVPNALCQVVQPVRITTIASHDGYSVLECWQIDSTPIEYMSALNYGIGGRTTNVKWSTLQPRTYVGEAWAPRVQLTIVLNGMIRVSAPYTPSQPAPSNATATGGCIEQANPGMTQQTAYVLSNRLLYQGAVPSAGADSQAPIRPPSEEIAYLMPGTMTSSIILVTDLRSESNIAGHGADFPSNEPTLLVQIPSENDEISTHCTWDSELQQL